jgi:hypothetical protein
MFSNVEPSSPIADTSSSDENDADSSRASSRKSRDVNPAQTAFPGHYLRSMRSKSLSGGIDALMQHRSVSDDWSDSLSHNRPRRASTKDSILDYVTPPRPTYVPKRSVSVLQMKRALNMTLKRASTPTYFDNTPSPDNKSNDTFPRLSGPDLYVARHKAKNGRLSALPQTPLVKSRTPDYEYLSPAVGTRIEQQSIEISPWESTTLGEGEITEVATSPMNSSPSNKNNKKRLNTPKTLFRRVPPEQIEDFPSRNSRSSPNLNNLHNNKKKLSARPKKVVVPMLDLSTDNLKRKKKARKLKDERADHVPSTDSESDLTPPEKIDFEQIFSLNKLKKKLAN